MKKGFVFVETMVVIAFLGTVLLTVYAAFESVIDSAKTRLFYDDPVYLYRTYYILNFLEENGLTDYINIKFASSTNIINEISCQTTTLIMVDESGGNSARDFCSTTFKEWNVNHIFIMPYNVSAIVSCANGPSDDNLLLCNRNTAMRNISLQAVDYLYSLDGYTGVYDENATVKHYRIVIEYKVDSKAKDYSYFDYETDGPCPSGQTKDPMTGKCKVSITTSKYYYSTLEVPFGNSNAVT